MSAPLDLVATCALGLETFVAAELRQLGISDAQRHPGGVSFRGTWADCWRANWRLRTANRVLLELGTWNGHDGDALHAGARNLIRRKKDLGGLQVGRLFSPEQTFSIHATSSASNVTDTRWLALRVKDGLVDGQRDRHGRRSSVQRDDPDLPLRLRLYKNQATLLLDTSGEPLDRRGYRAESVAAPVREQLAAACVLAADWQGGEGRPFYDPMCGSGTLLVEAAWWASGIAPANLRKRFQFQSLPTFDVAGFQRILDEEIPAPAPDAAILGSDVDARALAAAEANLRAAGVDTRIELRTSDFFQTRPPADSGLLLINPPYGERVEGKGTGRRDPDPFGPRLGSFLRDTYRGWRVVILAGGDLPETLPQALRLNPGRDHRVKNGPLDARILVFDLPRT